MVEREELMDMIDDSRPIIVKEYAKLITQLMTDAQLRRLQPFFIKRMDFDWRKAMNANEKPGMKHDESQSEEQDEEMNVVQDDDDVLPNDD